MYGNYSWQNYIVLRESHIDYEAELDKLCELYSSLVVHRLEHLLSRNVIYEPTNYFFDVLDFYNKTHGKGEKEFLLDVTKQVDDQNINVVGQTILDLPFEDMNSDYDNVILPKNSTVYINRLNDRFYIKIPSYLTKDEDLIMGKWIPVSGLRDLWGADTSMLDVKFEYQTNVWLKNRYLYDLAQNSYEDFYKKLVYHPPEWRRVVAGFEKAHMDVYQKAMDEFRLADHSMMTWQSLRTASEILFKLFNLKKFINLLVKHIEENPSVTKHKEHIKAVMTKYLATLKNLALQELAEKESEA